MGLRQFAFVITALSCIAAEPDPKVLRSPATIDAGEKLFVAACSGCHGKTGEGGRGPNLSDGVLIRRTRNDRLYASIHGGVPGTDMPGFPLEEAKVWSLVAFLRSLSAPAIQAPVSGDAESGRALFFGNGGCSNCHSIRGSGGQLGPDLSDIGANRTLKQLRDSIVDPSARVAEGFQPVKLTTADGRAIAGVAKNYNNYSVQVLTREGQLQLFDMAKVKEIAFEQKSLMPQNKLDESQLSSILAFLSKQAVRK